MADLAEEPVGPAPAPRPSLPLIWGKKEEVTQGEKKVGSARKTKLLPTPPPPLGLDPPLVLVSSRACHKLPKVTQEVSQKFLFVTKGSRKLPKQAKHSFLFLSCFI